jgi:putative restriction endonuclease
MKPRQKLWTRDELILAINLYCRLPFGRLHQRNPEIVHLANMIGRTPGSVAYKLVNFASLDPSLKARGIKGAANTSKLDKEIWSEFYNNWEDLPYESEKLWAKYENTSVESRNKIIGDEMPKVGRERERVVKARVNQAFFRSSILASYKSTCCITGINQPELLIAGHILPWGKDEKNRLNPRNGIAINALHDKAFENGLITISTDYKIKVSSILKKYSKMDAIANYFLQYNNKPMILPTRFLPDIKFLEYHNKNRFKP